MSMPRIFNVRNKKDIGKPRRASLIPLFLEPVLISMFVHRAIVNEGESASFSG